MVMRLVSEHLEERIHIFWLLVTYVFASQVALCPIRLLHCPKIVVLLLELLLYDEIALKHH